MLHLIQRTDPEGVTVETSDNFKRAYAEHIDPDVASVRPMPLDTATIRTTL